ncbi:hypothetical protein GWR56_13605 [Mucilaginibacter sp. 14171R-50]|uniref:hypothetical protein n=1 Tax=Mucilaginibacter sp. 14171R-50 TaxID=2703789 RepID=UPI00138B6DD3|nr:hypothetical protein [Mucilaginibacter sp. 14171R-50]QHS56524.1 hypothetical protein GWR56_13605 [Mucilaginibacter sp. 14171R-50]
MKKIFFITLLFLSALAGCNTYYVAATTEPIDLYQSEGAGDLAFNVPVGTMLLLRGSDRHGMRRVRFHNDANWYWAPSVHLSLVPGFNPKYYNETYASYESNHTGGVASSGGYDATIQTGSRGGKYYINKNGNKTYVKRSTPGGSVRHVGGSGSRGGRH